MKIKSLILYTLLVSVCLMPLACNKDEAVIPVEEDSVIVNLVLKMAVNPGASLNNSGAGSSEGSMSSRADDYSFEGPVLPWEGVQSIRIIIIHHDKDKTTVEINDKIDFKENDQIWLGSKEFTYKVVGGEKTVYLIGNEASLSQDVRDLLSNAPLPENLNEITLGVSYGASYINNDGENQKKYIPLSEIFKIQVMSGIPNTTVYDNGHIMFLTRVASKFSFEISNESDQTYKEDGLKITEIKVTGMSDVAWLFPHGTKYSPGKYDISNETLNGKAITEFKSPASEDDIYEYTFYPVEFGLNGNSFTDLQSKFTPLEYFLDSPAKEFYISLKAECNGLEQEFGPKKLPNLPFLARNTHVKISFAFKSLDAEVTVLPYTGVWLNPTFGIITVR